MSLVFFGNWNFKTRLWSTRFARWTRAERQAEGPVDLLQRGASRCAGFLAIISEVLEMLWLTSLRSLDPAIPCCKSKTQPAFAGCSVFISFEILELARASLGILNFHCWLGLARFTRLTQRSHAANAESAASFACRIFVLFKRLKQAWPFSENKNPRRAGEDFALDRDLAGARTQDPLLKREMLYQLSYQVKMKLKCLLGSPEGDPLRGCKYNINNLFFKSN